MTFTRVFTQSNREKDKAGVSNSNQQKKPMTIVKKAYKIQILRCLFFNQKTYVKAEREETLTHKVTQQRRHRGKTLTKQFGKVF